jgi:Cu(I)/Ag(I) efflux system membrane protein CusA/SilA
MTPDYHQPTPEQTSIIGRLLRFCLTNKFVVAVGLLLVIGAGIFVAPFDWEIEGVSRSPIATDAIPDVSENQQIVFTEWPGRSPQDVEDQITYPLTTALLDLPGIKTVRSSSMFGFSMINLIFEDGVDFYWARSRVAEELQSLAEGELPEGVRPVPGPAATALGQVFWYTLEGRDPEGNPAGGWDLEELRTIQDWNVRYALQSAAGVAEVASVGGHVREYQIDVNPEAMRAYGVTLPDVYAAVRGANIEVGARSIELNRVEYFVRGIGFIESIEDIEEAVVTVNDNVPITVGHVATVMLGPAERRGALDRDGAEAVGGVVVVRYGANPLSVIRNVKERIADISPGLPSKVWIDHTRTTDETIENYAHDHGFDAYIDGRLNQEAWLSHLRSTPREEWPLWATISQVQIVPFYDRTGLIYETLGTLNDALVQEILVTLLVVIIMMAHLRSSVLIGATLPLAVLMSFIAMKLFGVDANIVALSGIAIAIGTIVDMGIVICENILRHLDEAPPDVPRLDVVHRAASEVGGAVLTAVATTVVGFLPVFVMIGAQGKLFRPLAFTKTFALISSAVIALTLIPPGALVLFCGRLPGRLGRGILYGCIVAAGLILGAYGAITGLGVVILAGGMLAGFGIYHLTRHRLPTVIARGMPWLGNALAVILVGLVLAQIWEPLGPRGGALRNILLVSLPIGGVLVFFHFFRRVYPKVLGWALNHKAIFLSVIGVLVLFGFTAWLGVPRLLGWLPPTAEKLGISQETTRRRNFWVHAERVFPGLGREFMPPLDEGSYLFMPTTMVHASIGEALDILQMQDAALARIPEIESVVGKIGRAESPLDPAPISMIETVINYRPEYITDRAGRRITFAIDPDTGQFIRDVHGELVPDPNGQPYRQWRDHIHSPDDIWQEILLATEVPGTTSAPRLQPIAARIVMLQSGMRAPMGIKIMGPDLETIERVGLQIETLLRDVPGVAANTVIADRIVGKPYLEITPDVEAMGRYGITMEDFQNVIEVAIGGIQITTTVEGRERFPVRVRYQRELRDSVEALERILIPGDGGSQIPLIEIAEIQYVRGPQVIRSEDTFLTSYVLFDKQPGYSEINVVEAAQAYLQDKIDSGELILPAGVSYIFAGNYENHLRAQRTLRIVLPISMAIIFVLLYLQFRSVITSLLVFSGIFVAWSGGFILIWLYGQDWFLNFSLFGINMRELFQVHPINLSVAVWVGFLALFGIASDDGVVVSTYLEQVFRGRKMTSKAEVRQATIEAGKRRVRPCLMTTATTVLALLPVLSSTGRGADIMVPMAIPSFGGMLIAVLTMLTVPVLYCAVKEIRMKGV